MQFKKTLLALSLTTALVGCESINLSENQKTALGAGLGAVVGGVIGHQVNDKNGKYVGAVVGALAGGAIGKYMDSQQEKLEKALASSGISITRIDDATIKLNIPNSITFPVGKSELNPAVYNSLGAISSIFNKYNKTAVHVLGFADSTGEEQSNLELSQRRAHSAANYIIAQGVVADRLAIIGHGEQFPVATNDTKEGRAQNRRVEIYVRAVEKGNEQAAFNSVY